MPRDDASTLARMKAWLSEPGTRKRLRIVGLLLLLMGVGWAVTSLDLAWQDLSLPYLLANLVLLTPVLLIIAAWSFQVTASAAGQSATLGQALSIVAHANVAELLPLPGGAMVRGAALVDAGASAGLAAKLVFLTALLTLGLTVAVSSVALVVLDHALWGWLTLASLIGVGITLWVLARHAEPRLLVGMVGLRLLSLAVTAARLVLAFGALGQAISYVEGALYAVAPTMGAAVGIFPAGLGLNEAIAAGLATLIASSPATAFLAVALNRLLGLAVGAVFVFGRTLGGRQQG